MSRRGRLKLYLDYQSNFDHDYACWALNHGGWRKMKKLNRRVAKRRMYREEKEAVCHDDD